jgi:hypothetical protein
MLDYNDIEWNILGLAGGPDGSWGRGETDYLMALCRALDLRWAVIADRYSWADPEAAADSQPKQRGVDELKARYYSLAHTLLVSRSEGAETVAHKELVRRPYDASAEADRRDMLGALLQRSGGAAGEEEALLAAAAGVEARRRAEVDVAHKTGLPLQLLCRPAAPPPAQAPGGGGGSAVASLLGKLVIPDISIGSGDVDPNEEPGGPDLPTPRGQSQHPPPGCYARAAHTVACATELVALGGAGTQGKPRDRKAADSLNRRIDLAMDELGVPAPKTGTRAVCRAWYALRKEVAQLLEVRDVKCWGRGTGRGPLCFLIAPLSHPLALPFHLINSCALSWHARARSPPPPRRWWPAWLGTEAGSPSRPSAACPPPRRVHLVDSACGGAH